MNTEQKIVFTWPSLKDIAWLERAQFIFLIFHTFVYKFGRVEGAAREKNYLYRQMYGKFIISEN